MEILQLREFNNLKEVLVQKDGQDYFCTIFPNFPNYDTLKIGDKVEAYIRIKGDKKNLVTYWKPERTRLPDEQFI